MSEAVDIRPSWHTPSRRHKPARAGDVVTVWDRFEHREVVITVEQVRWDEWLYDGEWRIFAVGGGTYYTSADLRDAGLFALLASDRPED